MRNLLLGMAIGLTVGSILASVVGTWAELNLDPRLQKNPYQSQQQQQLNPLAIALGGLGGLTPINGDSGQ